jgi:polyvinyl alcohol dehydrogenase (cytochrome)
LAGVDTVKVTMAAVAVVVMIVGLAAPAGSVRDSISASSWPSYGHDAQHTFHGTTTLSSASVRTLARAWFYPTGLAVTATPTIVDGAVYVGSWDGFFYALDLRTGTLLWKFQLDAQPAVSPPPTGPPDPGSDGGIVVSSAWFEPANAHHSDLVIFGGGYTLYALDAHTGRLFWKRDYTGRPELPADPVHDETRMFSSPVVAHGQVLFGVTTDGQNGRRGYIAAANVNTGAPVWRFETDVDTAGVVQDDGCGGVWSSGTVLAAHQLVVFDVADCNFSDTGAYSETVLALHIDNGRLAWTFRPPRRDDGCDFDFGATPNAGRLVDGAPFLGVGGKDGTYYSLDPATGKPIWSTNVVFGGFTGGFIGTTAFDGNHVYGSTAIGDFGRFETNGPRVCDPTNPRDTAMQQPTVHAFNAATGAITYQNNGGASFSATTVAGGMTFNCLALASTLNVRNAADGTLLQHIPLDEPCWSGVATTGNTIIFGTGASYSPSGGVAAYTPNRTPPDSVSNMRSR